MLDMLERSDLVLCEVFNSSCSLVNTPSALHGGGGGGGGDTLIAPHPHTYPSHLTLKFINKCFEVFDQKWPKVDEKDPIHHDHYEAVPGVRGVVMRVRGVVMCSMRVRGVVICSRG